MNNANKIAGHMTHIITTIDEGAANPEKVMRACAKAIEVLAKEIDRIDTKRQLREDPTSKTLESFRKAMGL